MFVGKSNSSRLHLPLVYLAEPQNAPPRPKLVSLRFSGRSSVRSINNRSMLPRRLWTDVGLIPFVWNRRKRRQDGQAGAGVE